MYGIRLGILDISITYMVKKCPDLERGESASETGRDHIPPRVFKQMARLMKQAERLDMLLSDVKFSNYKERTAQVMAFLDKLYSGCCRNRDTDEEVSEMF